MRRLVLATGNPGKLAEFRTALETQGIEVLGLDALSDREEIAETGSTFEENARLKAEGYSRRTELPVIADDSGLVVDALHGEPGIHSARYGGSEYDDPGRCRLVLEKLRGVPQARRTARFLCVLALARAGRTLAVFNGSVEGRIIEELRGGGGFGYDPIFFHEGAGCSFAELSREEKQKLSHRGQAIARFLEAIRKGTVSWQG